MSDVEILFNGKSDSKELVTLCRAPAVGEWIELRGDEYQVTKVILTANKNSAVVSVAKPKAKSSGPAPRHG